MPPGLTLVRTRAVRVNGGGAMAGRAIPIRRVDTVRLGESRRAIYHHPEAVYGVQACLRAISRRPSGAESE
jgi:hypothetical protein